MVNSELKSLLFATGFFLIPVSYSSSVVFGSLHACSFFVSMLIVFVPV